MSGSSGAKYILVLMSLAHLFSRQLLDFAEANCDALMIKVVAADLLLLEEYNG